MQYRGFHLKDQPSRFLRQRPRPSSNLRGLERTKSYRFQYKEALYIFPLNQDRNQPQIYPQSQRPNSQCQFSEISKTGCWQLVEEIHLDHHKIIGHGLDEIHIDKLKMMYSNHCKLLLELE